MDQEIDTNLKTGVARVDLDLSGKILSAKGKIFMTTSMDDQINRIKQEAEKER